MTGFSRADGAIGDIRWHWEVRTVNGKSLDMRVRVPPGFEALEPEIRSAVTEYVRRGNCQLSLQVSRDQRAGEVRINEKALKSVIAAMKEISPLVEAGQPTLDGLLSIKGVVELTEPEDSEEAVRERNDAILEDLRSALAALKASREAEGARLHDVLAGQIDEVERLTAQARDCPARTADAIKKRLGEQLDRLLGQNTGLDETRLHQEAVLLAAKADIQEELDRLAAHVEAARDLLDDAGAVGRKLDFLMQEFNREANTLCSKANAPELSAIGLDLKAVIDQMREQVQNVE